jgi:hypothetical protein
MSLHSTFHVLGQRISDFTIENTVGKLFIGGKNMNDVKRYSKKLKGKNINCIVDYGIEDLTGVGDEV